MDQCSSHGKPGAPAAPELSHGAAVAPRLPPRQALRHYEALIEQSLARKNDRAMALLAVYESKLYQLTHTSFSQYFKQRWRLSRTRGYQQIHFALVRRHCLQNGLVPPTNERQARQFAADGTSLQLHHDSYAQCFHRARRNLVANLTTLPPGEHPRFMEDIRRAFDQVERERNIQPLMHLQASPGMEPTGAAEQETETQFSNRCHSSTGRPGSAP